MNPKQPILGATMLIVVGLLILSAPEHVGAQFEEYAEPGVEDQGSSLTRDESPGAGSQTERDVGLGQGSLSVRTQEQRQRLERLRCLEQAELGTELPQLQQKRCLELISSAEENLR